MATAVESAAATPLSSNSANQKQQQQQSSTQSPIYLTFPDEIFDEEEEPAPPSLSCLTDEHSALIEVSQVCFYLHQQLSDEVVLHDVTVAQFWSDAWRALLQCVQDHHKRQCRIVAAKTAALTARSVYARIRPVIQLYSQREATPGRVEDEVLDVAMGLVNACLSEEDDGVAIAILGSLGHLVLTSNPR